MQESGYSKSYVTTNLSSIRCFYNQINKVSCKLPSNKELSVDNRTKEDRIGKNRAWTNHEVNQFIEYAQINENDQFSDMIRLARDHGLRIHEFIRFDRTHLKTALNEGKLTIKGKDGLI